MAQSEFLLSYSLCALPEGATGKENPRASSSCDGLRAAIVEHPSSLSASASGSLGKTLNYIAYTYLNLRLCLQGIISHVNDHIRSTNHQAKIRSLPLARTPTLMQAPGTIPVSLIA